ncbi:endonuclease domain-containing protein [Herbiconiux sp. CPCC 205763]|uniref:Endonuclease domain-containing protein n=1 Tax=Herbiconiux aconitum TaxID=2970913 RepID=A0ABT2GQK2_9MICO|nr:type IV toxin-antitoxin system AbiEi family antitoxin domain-containing protein [Herbiconiux aconitum]MCS5718507.1 endonuclease domain-containing protein [Herbiconiux aconitum]
MDILEFTHHQGAVASAAHLHSAGFSPADITRSLRRGELERVTRGWLAAAGASSPAIGAIRLGGRISCLDVLRAHRVWAIRDPHPHISAGRHSGHSPSAADGRHSRTPTVIHRALPAQPLGLTAFDPLPVALGHAVMCQPWMDAVASLDSALNRGDLSTFQLADLLDPLPARYARFFDMVDAGSESGLETKARLSLRAATIRYRTQVTITGAGIVDNLIGDRLVLELDGWEWHSKKEDFERDRMKDLVLHSLDFRVVRLSYEQVTLGWQAAFEVVRSLVARGEHRWSGRQRRAAFGA